MGMYFSLFMRLYDILGGITSHWRRTPWVVPLKCCRRPLLADISEQNRQVAADDVNFNEAFLDCMTSWVACMPYSQSDHWNPSIGLEAKSLHNNIRFRYSFRGHLTRVR